MRAVIWVGAAPAGPMAQLLDRPFLQHVVEQLVQRGVSRLDVFLPTNNRREAEALLGDGTRWGITIATHGLSSPPAADDFAALELCPDELALCGPATCLPALPMFADAAERTPSLFFHERRRINTWTGWALAPGASVSAFALAAEEDRSNWGAAAQQFPVRMNKVFLESPSLLCGTVQEVLDANRMALDQRFKGMLFDGVEREPGVWVARAVKLPASARVQGPCYIGEQAWVGEQCSIGPYAVVGRDCVVERGTAVTNSVVREGTYLGPQLEVADAVVADNLLHNVRLGVSIRIQEQYVASSLTAGPMFPVWIKWTAAFIGAVSLALLLPLLLRR